MRGGRLDFTWHYIFYFFAFTRYVQEWLSSMIAAGIFHQNPETSLYYVPENHKQVLMTKIGFSRIIAESGRRMDLVKQCFKEEGPAGSCFIECLN